MKDKLVLVINEEREIKMVFSSMIFLWVFLPVVLVLYKISHKKFKNTILLISSLIFYSWGEPRFIVLMIISIIINYIFGLIIYKEEGFNKRKVLLILSLIANLGILSYFKYFNFFVSNINMMFKTEVFELKTIILPIGISFYTFQALSYVVDVYRSKNINGELKAQRNIFNLALYITFFPQLIAGPIVKYHDIEKQIYSREESAERTAYGIKRFMIGMSKKVLISNVLALVADSIFMTPVAEIGTGIAWLGIVSYTLQIYYDFSGYSDMAIGLGEIFGFTFMENFNYPYISQSIQEFWRRWHISLSTWFKEYLYIPLGGNRKGKYRTYINLFIVFFSTGLWHGASFNFIIWGMFHGIFIIIERIFLGNILKKNKLKFINHIYVLLVVMTGWVFFRVETLKDALAYIKVMFIPTTSNPIYTLSIFINSEVIIALIIGILFAGFIQMLIPKFKERLFTRDSIKSHETIIITSMFIVAVIYVISGTYNPFIYFRF